MECESTPEKVKNATVTSHFGFVFEKKIKLPGQGNSMIIVASGFSKSSVFKMYSVHTKMQSWCFQIPSV